MMKLIIVLVATGILAGASAEGPRPRPEMGWNSFDSFVDTITEQEFLENAQVVGGRLLDFGYDTVTVDFGWYSPSVTSDEARIDEFGRPLPWLSRFPSAVDSLGFKPLADQVHALGLKFGIHIMRGIHLAAIKANSPVKGTDFTARDIAIFGVAENPGQCLWYPQFHSVNITNPAGQAFYNSLLEQYVEWGVDFLKYDCVFAEQFSPDDIFGVAKAIENSGKEIPLSLSPGSGAVPAMANVVQKISTQYRVSGDVHDHWEQIEAQFMFAPFFEDRIGLPGSPGNGGSWPDLDMLPLGWVCDGVGSPDTVPPGYCDQFGHLANFTDDEEQSLLTLWSIARAPLIMGGDVRPGKTEDHTFVRLTNRGMLEVNQMSKNNKQLERIGTKVVWMAQHEEKENVTFVAMFNLAEFPDYISVQFQKLGISEESCIVTDLWNNQVTTELFEVAAGLQPHASALLQLECM